MMLIGEASAVNRVIDHLCGVQHTDGQPMVTRERAIDALVLLAKGAYKTLQVGYTPDDSGQFSARAALEARWPGALREVVMLEMHGGEPEPWVSDATARHHAITAGGWDPGTDLAWRTGRTDSDGRSAKVLYANGAHTLCNLWPASIRGLDALTASADADAEAAAANAPDESAAACKVCGCTEDEPCEGGCAWVTGEENSLAVDLCSACAWAIARDAIASGLYHLEETAGDTIFEARGGLIPQPMLTDREITSLQPLMDAVEAANGDPDKLAEIAREHGVPRLRLPEGVNAQELATALADEPGRLWILPPQDFEPFADRSAEAAEALRTVNDTIAQLAERTRRTAPGGITPDAYARALAEDLMRSVRAGAYTGVFGLEWSFRSGGLSGPVMSETEARKHVTDLRRLYDDEVDRADYAVQLRLVGPWVDDPEPPRADDQREPELTSQSATDNEALSDTDQPLGERDTA